MDNLSNLPTFLALIGATAAIILLVVSIWGSWNDARKARILDAKWKAYLARENDRIRREEEKKKQPIEWPKADEYLDPAHLEVRHETGATDLTSFIGSDGQGYGIATTYDANGKIVTQKIHRTGLSVKAE